MNSPIHMIRCITLLSILWIGEFFILSGQVVSAFPDWIGSDGGVCRKLSLFSVSDSKGTETDRQSEALFRAAAFESILRQSFYSRKVDVYNEKQMGRKGKRLVKTMIAIFAEFDTVGFRLKNHYLNSYGEVFVDGEFMRKPTSNRFSVELIQFKESFTNTLQGGRIDWIIREMATGQVLYTLTSYQSGRSLEVVNQFCNPGETVNQFAFNRYPHCHCGAVGKLNDDFLTPTPLSFGLFQAALRAFSDALFVAFDHASQVSQQETYSNVGSQKIIDSQSIGALSIEIPYVSIQDNKISLSVNFTPLNESSLKE